MITTIAIINAAFTLCIIILYSVIERITDDDSLKSFGKLVLFLVTICLMITNVIFILL